MTDYNLLNNNLFDLDSSPFKELLYNKNPWESIADLSEFIENLFRSNKITANYKDKKNVFVGEGTLVHPTVDIVGPAIIGTNCDIRHTAYLRENCLIGDNVVIGHAVEVKHSIFLNSSAANHFCYIGDSIIGNHVNISGGAIFANLRLDKKKILIKYNNNKIDTGLNKFGSAIGDNSVIGVNSVLNPGTILGKNTFVFPLKSASGVYGENSKIT